MMDQSEDPGVKSLLEKVERLAVEAERWREISALSSDLASVSETLNSCAGWLDSVPTKKLRIGGSAHRRSGLNLVQALRRIAQIDDMMGSLSPDDVDFVRKMEAARAALVLATFYSGAASASLQEANRRGEAGRERSQESIARASKVDAFVEMLALKAGSAAGHAAREAERIGLSPVHLERRIRAVRRKAHNSK